MALIDRLKAAQDREESYFRRHLIREDVARLETLAGLAAEATDDTAYLAAALRLGWTAEDRRTHELEPTLRPFLLAFRATARAGDESSVDGLDALWQAFDNHRMERLVGCLSRVPRPE